MRSSRQSGLTDSFRRATARTAARFNGWPRRVAAASCFLIAVWSFLGSRGSSAARPVWVAERDLPAGAVITAADVRRTTWPASLVPTVTLTSARDIVGRSAAVALARGEPLTSTRMLDTSVLAGLRAGQVAAPVTLPDRGQRAVLRVGAVVDLYATGPGLGDGSLEASADASDGMSRASSTRGASRPIVSNVRLLAVLPQSEGSSDSRLTALVAVDRAEATRLASHGSTEMLATLVPPP